MEKLAQNRTKNPCKDKSLINYVLRSQDTFQKTFPKGLNGMTVFADTRGIAHGSCYPTFTCTAFHQDFLSPGLAVGSPSFSNPTTP